MSLFRSYKTLSPTNEFRFVCPIFHVEAKMRQCVQIRDLKYAGKPPAVRKGCQACVSAGKCPAAEIIRRISFGNGHAPDDYGSDQPIVGKLRLDVLEKLAPVIVPDQVLNAHFVPDGERALIATSSERIRKAAASAPMPSDGRYRAMKEVTTSSRAAPPARRKSSPKTTPDNDNRINNAAATGDLAAAIS